MDDLLEHVNRPPTAGELRHALSLLGASAHPHALAMLATPNHELPTVTVRETSPGVLTWRNIELTNHHDPEHVAAWVSAAWQPTDVFAVPQGPLWAWVRLRASGAGAVLWGPNHLWRGAVVTCSNDITEPCAVELCRAWWEGRIDDPPAMLSIADTPVFLDGDDTAWKVTADTHPRCEQRNTPTPQQVRDVVAQLADQHHANSWTARPGTAGTLVGTLGFDEFSATFDITTNSSGTLSVGRRVNLKEPAVGPEFPGWDVLGSASGVHAARSNHGLFAVLRPYGPGSGPTLGHDRRSL